MISSHNRFLLAMLFSFSLALTACSDNQETNVADGTQTGVTSTTEVTTTTTSSNPDTQKNSAKVITTDETGGNIPDVAKGENLALDKFSEASGKWSDSSFDVANQAGVTGIGTELKVCGTPKNAGMADSYGEDGHKLRLNLGHKYKTLKFNVGQGNGSSAIDQSVLVRVTDGAKQFGDIYKVNFDEIKPIEVDVAGKNVVILQFYLDDQVKKCGQESVTAVLYNIQLD